MSNSNPGVATQPAPPKTADVVVIGAGISGLSTAFQLVRRRAGNVVVLERKHIGAGASGKSGALVRAHYSNVPESTLTFESLKIFRNWGEEVGHGDPGLQVTRFLRVAAPADEANLRANVAAMQKIGIETSIVSADDLREIEPLMRTDDFDYAAFEPTTGYVDPNATIYGYAEAATELGASICTGVEATRILVEGDRVTGVETTAGTISTRKVVLAGGPWADRLLKPLGVDLGLTPYKAQVVVFRWPVEMDQARKHRVVIDSIHHSWLRTEGEASTLIGVEFPDRKIDPDHLQEFPDPAYVEQARAALAARFPVFEHSTMRGGWAGVFMQSPDDHPIMDRLSEIDGLFVITGDSGSAFKIGPAVGMIFAEWVTEGTTTMLDMTPFRASRFAEGEPWVDEFAYGRTSTSTVSR
jgi:sarcosine oxidase subunit beta